MFGPKSNIYVSFNNDYDYVKNAAGKHVMRSNNGWMLSVEPSKHLLSTTDKATPPKHLTARYDETWKEYALQSVVTTNLGIAGSIMIAHNVDATSEVVIDHLRGKFANAPSPPAEMATSAGPEYWIRMALHALMDERIIDEFDVEDFMTFARGYLRDRLSYATDAGAAMPSVVSYAHLRKETVKKPKRQGLWFTYPMATSNRTGDRIYGGLM